MSNPAMPRAKVFVSYSHLDVTYFDQLQIHLAPYIREGKFDVWDDKHIEPGTPWREHIQAAIDAANIAILLISARYLASKFIAENEIPFLVEAAKQQKIKIFSVILSPCAFEGSPLEPYQTINPPSEPLINMSPGKQEETWATLTRRIAATVAAPDVGAAHISPFPPTESPNTEPIEKTDSSRPQEPWPSYLPKPEQPMLPPHHQPLFKNRGWFLILAGLLVALLLVAYLFVHAAPPHQNNTAVSGSPTTSAAPSPTATPVHDDSASSLIPAGQQPVINDPLKDNSHGYGWDSENDSAGTCGFAQGQYVLTSPPNSDGVGCNTNSDNSHFSNFVYQIRMTILQGLDDQDNSAVGPTFRVNTNGSGQQYQVTFDVDGDWDVATDQNDLVAVGAACANPCPYFHSGLHQPNYITIRADGSSIQIQINGYPLGSYTNSAYASGYIGVQLSPGKDAGSVEFSDVRVWQLPATS